MGSVASPVVQAALNLRPSLSESTGVFTDPSSDEFKTLMQRWSDLDVKEPAAILTPSSEEDIVQIVQHAVNHSIPFVSKAGGHSPWSTIDSSGWIVDLTRYTGIKIDIQAQTATVQAGVITKPLNQAVHKAGFFIQSSGAASVGHIPFVLGGGQSWMTDQLVSAKVVTASKGLVVASETENADLFWALKGAGQFFGLVTEVTMRVFPIEQDILSWNCIFLPHQIKEVGQAIEKCSSEDNVNSPGVVIIIQPPGQTKPIIMVSTKHFGTEEEALKAMQPLLDAKPVQQIKETVSFANVTDSTDALNRSGGIKRQISCGMRSFSAEKLEESLTQWNQLVEKHPGAAASFFMFTWVSTEAMSKVPQESTCWSHRDCGIWRRQLTKKSMSFVSGVDEESATAASESAESFLAMCQKDQSEAERSFFPNHTRAHKLEHRYRDAEARKRLRELKSQWDPEGFFTRQFI
ncbi:FAD-linked oxidoreductase chyH [Hyphodiscus hymeniophilus]|uniref:FAD-linked oxidoreductase chyH n=1 Tax=Hyphodiscus hymeniophilus TaxID=353542 RepID=A0A9P6VHK6_9HELO|nr:FAD-linked oxidoreductase chyH [Hyphodiscus hymeniophilus]